MNLPETRDEHTAQSSAASTRATQHAGRQALIDQLQRYGMLILFFVIAAIFSILRPDRFPTAQNLRSILTENSLLGIAALAVMLAVIAAEWDLSVAAVVGLGNFRDPLPGFRVRFGRAKRPVERFGCLFQAQGVVLGARGKNSHQQEAAQGQIHASHIVGVYSRAPEFPTPVFALGLWSVVRRPAAAACGSPHHHL